MDITTDNQQERRFGWLAGIIDGEGTISMQTYRHHGHVRLTPFICIVNSSQEIIQKCNEILEEIGVAKHYTHRKPNKKKANGLWYKPCKQIRIDGYKSVLKLAQAMDGYLIGKTKQAELIKEYIKNRQGMKRWRNEKGHVMLMKYTPREIDILVEIKSLNRNESPETIRQTLNERFGDDIVRTHDENVRGE
ncbi:MAG: LAGLIDADG family homing endonuclease [Patescibacteria group bacterium]|nr:LAGLIDADG family homing endonuclease [Patescibacteria group bacterium]